MNTSPHAMFQDQTNTFKFFTNFTGLIVGVNGSSWTNQIFIAPFKINYILSEELQGILFFILQNNLFPFNGIPNYSRHVGTICCHM